MGQIKTAVSLYSLQDSYARGRLDLAGALEFVASTGAQGVELISDQMIKGTPFPSDEMVTTWRAALEKSGLAPVCNDIFINSTIYWNRRCASPSRSNCSNVISTCPAPASTWSAWSRTRRRR